VGKLIKFLIPLGILAAVVTWVVLDNQEVSRAEDMLAQVASDITARLVQIDRKGVIQDVLDISGGGTVAFGENGRPDDTATRSLGVCKTLHAFQKGELPASVECANPAGKCTEELLATASALHTLAH